MKSRSILAATLFSGTVIVVFLLLQMKNVEAEAVTDQHSDKLLFHPPAGTPVNLGGYRLPFDRNSISVITNGPYEGTHVAKSNEAIDFSPKGGWTDIYAAKAGYVYINRNYGDWGNLVILCHEADGFCTYYAHLQSLGAVAVGSAVYQGQYIGRVGNTGCGSCGTHLHWEARDGMTPTPNPTATLNPQAAYGGDSTRHSLRRVRGIGWYPWYPNPSNSGFTIRALPPHAVQQCTNQGTITLQLPSHSQLTHSQTERYSVEVTHNQKNYLPPNTVNLEHATPQATRQFVADGDTKKYWLHARAFDATTNEWARDDEVAHQGPYKLELTCPMSLPPNYKDDLPQSDDNP